MIDFWSIGSSTQASGARGPAPGDPNRAPLANFELLGQTDGFAECKNVILLDPTPDSDLYFRGFA